MSKDLHHDGNGKAASGWKDAMAQSPDLDSMIRVDQAGEYGATRIYAGQLAIMGDRAPQSAKIAHMAEQEEVHLAFFDKVIAERGVRPTLLQPFWNAAGFGLGAATALMGPKAAMACTVAVETEIGKHYQDQLDTLDAAGNPEPKLREKIAQFRDEELEHLDTAIDEGAEQAVAYPLLSAAIRLGCRFAIKVAQKI